MFLDFSLSTVRCLCLAFTAICCVLNIFDFNSAILEHRNMLSEKEAIDDAPDAPDAVIDDAPAIYARYSRILYLLKTNK